MAAPEISALPVGVLDGRFLSDDALRRLAVGGTELTAFSSSPADRTVLAERWARIAPGRAFHDGGVVRNVREAITECARRQIIVLACPPPAKPAEFVGLCLQGAATTGEFDVPAFAVHVMRDEVRPGSVAWLTDTGELSGYGILFAVGYATLHGTDVELVEPAHGLGRPRTPEVVEQAIEGAGQLGVSVIRHSDPSPIARVLRDEHCLVVHPVLDAPKGFNLLHPGHLPHKAVAHGSPAVVVELLEKFPGDVVAVFDSVRLIQGEMPAGRVAAAAALGLIAAAGIGVATASPAAAAPSMSSTHIPAGHHYGWCKNPNNPHFDSEGCGPRPVDWVDPGVQQGPTQGPTQGPDQPTPTQGPDQPTPTQGPDQPTPTQGPDQQVPTPDPVKPDVVVPPVVVTGTVETITGYGPVPTPSQVPTPDPQAPTPTTVVAPPLATPQVPTPSQVPTPDPQAPTPTTVVAPPLQGPPVVVTGTVNTFTGYGPVQQAPQPTEVPPTTVTAPVDVPGTGGGDVVVTPSTPGTPDGPGATTPGSGASTPDVPTPGTATETPGDGAGGVVPQGTPTTTEVTGHREEAPTPHPFDHTATPITTPTVQTVTVTDQGPTSGPGELAHTGGNTAILAIVAGSLLAAGAGLAVAGRMGSRSEESDAAES